MLHGCTDEATTGWAAGGGERCTDGGESGRWGRGSDEAEKSEQEDGNTHGHGLAQRENLLPLKKHRNSGALLLYFFPSPPSN